MYSKLISLEETIDDALRKASKVLMLISLPALLLAAYRNLIVEFLPLHQILITLIWFGFLLASLNISNLIKFRVHLVVFLFFALFMFTGYRNQSFIFVDVWLIIAGGLMAFRQSLRVVFVLLAILPIALLLIINERFKYPGIEYELHLAIHGTALLLSFVLFYTIRNVVQNYQTLYESQVTINASLNEENKKSYLRIVEGKETVNEERQRLKLSAFSLSSQMSILEKVVQFAKKNDDPMLLGYSSTRIEELHKDLLDYSKDGSYISSETKILSISELAFSIEQYLRPFKAVLAGLTTISVENHKILDLKFEFPINFIKIICHHLMENCLEELSPNKVVFDFQIVGKEIRNKQQIKMTCCIELDRGLKDFDPLKFNKAMENNQILKKSQSHTAVMKALVNRLSGKLDSSVADGCLEFKLLFWVNVFEETRQATPPPKIRDIFGFE
jgi:hypothetical protein